MAFRSPIPPYSPPVFAAGSSAYSGTTGGGGASSNFSPPRYSDNSLNSTPVQERRGAVVTPINYQQQHHQQQQQQQQPRIMISPSHRRTTTTEAATMAGIERDIHELEDKLLQTKLRGEWASRRIIAIESARQREVGTLHRLERRLTPSASSSSLSPSHHHNHHHQVSSLNIPPSAKELHDEISERIALAEANNRRIRDAEAEVAALKEASERSHSEKLRALKRRRDEMMDRKMVAESQLRVMEGSVRDDDMISDAQYRRYAARIESDRQEAIKRHESSAKQAQARSELRCSFIQKETDELVASVKKLVREKTLEVERMAQAEHSGTERARGLGARLEEIEDADRASAKLRSRLELVGIQEREARSEAERLTEEMRRTHVALSEMEGKIIVAAPEVDAKQRAQEAVLEGLYRTVRTLQERIAGDHRSRRNQPMLVSEPGLFVDRQLEQLDGMQRAVRAEILQLRSEEAKLSDFWTHLDDEVRAAALQGELLSAKIARARFDERHGESLKAEHVGMGMGAQYMESRGVTAVGAATMFVSPTRRSPAYR